MKGLKKVLLVLFLICLCNGCHDGESIPDFQVYNLPGHCELNIEVDTVVAVNSKAEFQALFSEYPEMRPVDFRKSTLLVAKGTSLKGIEKIDKEIVRTGGRLEITIDIKLNLTPVFQKWCLAYVVPKVETRNIIYAINYR